MSAQSTQYPIVLVVENEPSDRIVLHRAFESAHTKAIIYWVQNGIEASCWLETAVLEQSPLPDCIIVDLKAPVVGATELFSLLRTSTVLRPIQVLVLGDGRSFAGTSGAFVVKPFSFDSLVEAIRAMGQRWQAEHPSPVAFN